jgi:hypothetical protein
MPTTDALVALRGPLERLGFRKRGGQIYTIDLGEDVLGWLGLNKASQHRSPGQVEVNPVIGVRHQQVERLVAELLAQPFHDYQPPTVSSPVGYLLPERKYTSWLLGEGASPEAVEDLLAAVEGTALPWMRSLLGLTELREALDARLGHQPEYRLPIVLALQGEHAEAASVLQKSVDQLGGRTDAAAELLRQYADAFVSCEWPAR